MTLPTNTRFCATTMPITGKDLLLLMRLGRLFSRWVAIANRERKAELPALQHFNDQDRYLPLYDRR